MLMNNKIQIKISKIINNRKQSLLKFTQDRIPYLGHCVEEPSQPLHNNLNPPAYLIRNIGRNMETYSETNS